MPPKVKPLDLHGTLKELSDRLLYSASFPNVDGYEPSPKQALFHSDESYLRLFLGGNRSGKTHGCVVEDWWWATNTHPFIPTPKPPVYIRVVVVDFERGLGDIMLPKFKALARPNDLVGNSFDKAYSKQEKRLFFKNGSEIQFMSYEQELEKFAGASKHLIHFDEEPPKHIYNECAARIIDTNGRIIVSMTPVDGITWMFHDIYEPVNADEDKIVLIEGNHEIGPVYKSPSKETIIIEVGMNENKYLSPEAQKRYLDTLEPEEREARAKGQFVPLGGKVFRNFSERTHVVDQITNPGEYFEKNNWRVYSSVDTGWNNPTAWLWHAVSPRGEIITFWEHYAAELTVAEHALIVHEIERTLGLNIYLRTGDPALKQTREITGTSVLTEYAKHDISIYVDSVPREVSIGIDKMHQYFKLREDGHPTWIITKNCRNFIREMRNLQWAKYDSRKTQFKNNKQESVQKKDDHAFDSARYFSTFLPDLKPDPAVLPKRFISGYTVLNRYDDALVASSKRKREEQEGTLHWDIVPYEED